MNCSYFSWTLLVVLLWGGALSALSEREAEDKLKKIHSRLSLVHGSLNEEYPEQLMAVMFISKKDRVLELGGNVGRNSCVIGSLLKKSENLVVVESDPNIAGQLKENRDYNGLWFKIEDSALSKVPLIQSGWNTVPSSVLLPGYFWVKTVSYADLKKKYAMDFNVLVADCEGALYFILRDDETLLSDVETIIVENDYTERGHYDEVRYRFEAHGFQLVYSKEGPWGPCRKEFYQVWKKRKGS